MPCRDSRKSNNRSLALPDPPNVHRQLPPGTLPRPLPGLPRCHRQLHDNSATFVTCAQRLRGHHGSQRLLHLLRGFLPHWSSQERSQHGTSAVLTCITPKRGHCSTPSAGAHCTDASTFLSSSRGLQVTDLSFLYHQTPHTSGSG